MLSKVVPAISMLGNGVGGGMATVRHYTTCHTLWFCSVRSNGTVFAEHAAHGPADFKTLMRRCLNQGCILSIVLKAQKI
jgi:hypothetical protein